MSKKKLVQGVGNNDAGYSVLIMERLEERLPNGQRKQKLVWSCPYYNKWRGMLERCYSKKCEVKHPTYKECTVCKEWLLFSTFKKWMITKDWEGRQLDKDVLLNGNKIYSPETCVFISGKVNNFIINSKGARGRYLIGCSWDKYAGLFKAEVNNPFKGKRVNLGRYKTELEAHFAWKYQKHLYSCQLANSEHVTDERVRQVLLHRYENYTIVEDHLK